MIFCRPRTRETNVERKGSSFLGFQTCFEVGDCSDSLLCGVCLLLIPCDTCICMNVSILITLVENDLEE